MKTLLHIHIDSCSQTVDESLVERFALLNAFNTCFVATAGLPLLDQGTNKSQNKANKELQVLTGVIGRASKVDIIEIPSITSAFAVDLTAVPIIKKQVTIIINISIRLRNWPFFVPSY